MNKYNDESNMLTASVKVRSNLLLELHLIVKEIIKRGEAT